jgi:hypothetical protein
MSDSSVSTPCQRLQEADQAYHDLMRGALARSVTDENNESIAFTQANADALLNYIRQLAPLCPDYIPTALGAAPVRQPLRFLF